MSQQRVSGQHWRRAEFQWVVDMLTERVHGELTRRARTVIPPPRIISITHTPSQQLEDGSWTLQTWDCFTGVWPATSQVSLPKEGVKIMLEDGEYRTRTHLEVYSPHIPQHHSHVLSLFYVITSFDGREIRYDRPMRTRAINVFAARRPELAPDTAISAALAGSTSAIGDLLGHQFYCPTLVPGDEEEREALKRELRSSGYERCRLPPLPHALAYLANTPQESNLLIKRVDSAPRAGCGLTMRLSDEKTELEQRRAT